MATRAKSKARFILHGGYCRSVSDGDVHYVAGSRLIQLYKLNPLDCILCANNEDVVMDSDNFVHLSPRPIGDYRSHLQEELTKLYTKLNRNATGGSMTGE